ncbi:MAG: rhodanese-like domain-containing protein [Dehalococcoidia bacterium]|nr:rhodanese-like domain-containing protein [Dehalococcoidia bacterium]
MESEEVRIDLAEAKARIDAGQAIVLDVVSSHAWEQMHRSIAGATRIDPAEIEQRYGQLPLDRQIIAYCT